MKAFLLAALIPCCLSSSAQYYYKDIIGTKASSEIIRAYTRNKVNRVVLTSYDQANQKDDDFFVEQAFSPATKSLRTITRSESTHESVLISYVDANDNVIRTIDSSDIVVSTTDYRYNAAGQLVAVSSSSADSSDASQNEEHIWEWNNGRPSRMLRVKNGKDTSIINFKLDEKGNISEETETRKGVTSLPVYYYYNDNNQLTDIVRFNKRANRLLPEYMFEYSADNQLVQKITVPSNNSEYLIWRYQYNNQGLKVKEVIYNKQKQMTGKVEYQYSFGS
jgi:hypothetical protein